MKLDHFTGGVTLDFRALLEGLAGLATSAIAFFVAPGNVGPLWPRVFRADQKVLQVLWPSKRDSVIFRDPPEGSRCSESSGCPPRCPDDEEDLSGMLPPVEPCLRLPLVSEPVAQCVKQTWLALRPPLWLTPGSLSARGARASPATSCRRFFQTVCPLLSSQTRSAVLGN